MDTRWSQENSNQPQWVQSIISYTATFGRNKHSATDPVSVSSSCHLNEKLVISSFLVWPPIVCQPLHSGCDVNINLSYPQLLGQRWGITCRILYLFLSWDIMNNPRWLLPFIFLIWVSYSSSLVTVYLMMLNPRDFSRKSALCVKCTILILYNRTGSIFNPKTVLWTNVGKIVLIYF